MTTLNVVFLVFGILFFVLFILFVVFRLVFRMMKRRHEKFLQNPMFQHIELSDGMANFFGSSSLTRRQIRGNGLLALTSEALVFKMYAGQREINIPIRDLLSADKADSFMGKTIFRKLLEIKYKTSSGEETSVWYVKNLDTWIEKIKAHLPKQY